MGDLVQHIAQNLRQRRLFRPGQAILVAVSGGLDSMVLLRILKELSGAEGWRLAVAHLNHCLRGRSSDADERFVLRAAQKFGLEVSTERADVRRFARENRLSLEMAARKLRHEFLARAAARVAAPSVALAHHADDQLELFFLRLLRGSGSEGLAGMKWSNPSPADPRLALVRPLLDQPKSDLLKYALENKVGFREDATNALLDIQRNRIRHELLPLLRARYQPGLDKILLRTMEILGAEGEFVGRQAHQALKELKALQESEKSGSRTQSALAKLPVAVQRRHLQLQLLELGVTPDFELIESLRTNPGRPFPVPQTDTGRLGLSDKEGDNKDAPLLATRQVSGLIRIEPAVQAQFSEAALQLDLAGGAREVSFAGARMDWSLEQVSGRARYFQRKRSRPAPRRTGGREYFDADRTGLRVWLRHWRPGDRFQPIGMSVAVKLQDFFTNHKVPRALRRQRIVATTEQGELFWVEGMRISERFKLTKDSIHCLHWRWQRG